MTSWNHVTFVDIVVKFKEKSEERYPSYISKREEN
jgi:hypothetical protein